MLFFQLLNIGFNFIYKHQEDKVTQWTFYSSAVMAAYYTFLSSLISYSIEFDGHLLNAYNVKGTVLGTCLLFV